MKGEILKEREVPMMSIWDVEGNEIPVKFSDNGKYFSVTPYRDGTYRIRVAFGPDTNGRKQVTVAVSLIKQIKLSGRELYYL